ncbi:MAG: hypothetical protein AB9869_36910 [Verrucomicrobiia bacterium]
MKRLLLLFAFTLVATASLSAALHPYTFDAGFENPGPILDANANPWNDTRLVSGLPETGVTDLRVRLTVSGGFNGDLYGYLSFDGALVPLLNRVGVGEGDPFGYADSGLSVTFADTAANNIHFYQAVPGYSISGGSMWKPDGTATLRSLLDQNPNGEWTLVLADLSGGGGEASVASWGLDFETALVPEPSTWIAGMLLLIPFGAGLVRKIRNC